MANKKFMAFLNRKQIEFSSKHGKQMSSGAFADWLGVKQSSLSNWMNGEREPTGVNLIRLADKLGPEVYDLLGLPRMAPSDPLFRDLMMVWSQIPEERRKKLLELAQLAANEETEFNPVVSA